MTERRSKYGARKAERDGHTFDSQAEARRYDQLKLLAAAGEVTDLELQPQYPLVINGHKICTYIADFRYNDRGIPVVEDTKGFKTPEYRLKKKLVKAVYGIEILETTA